MNQNLFPRDTPFRSFSGLLQQGLIGEQGTELFWAVIAVNEPGQLLEAGSVPTGQEDTPAPVSPARRERVPRLLLFFFHYTVLQISPASTIPASQSGPG